MIRPFAGGDPDGTDQPKPSRPRRPRLVPRRTRPGARDAAPDRGRGLDLPRDARRRQDARRHRQARQPPAPDHRADGPTHRPVRGAGGLIRTPTRRARQRRPRPAGWGIELWWMRDELGAILLALVLGGLVVGAAGWFYTRHSAEPTHAEFATVVRFGISDSEVPTPLVIVRTD